MIEIIYFMGSTEELQKAFHGIIRKIVFNSVIIAGNA